MILIDTSAWIEFFNRGSASPHGERIASWLRDEMDICLTEIIATEILQGISKQPDFRAIRSFILDIPVCSLRDIFSYFEAANIYRVCRRRGVTLRSTIDCLIAQVALENDLQVYHKDRDFDAIAKLFPLRLAAL